MRVRSGAQVRQFVEQQPAGEPFSPTDLLLYGTRAGVDQTLSRLTREGVIERVARGIYVKPRRSAIVGPVPPSLQAVARTYARAHRMPVTNSGAQVLAEHGLSTQTPVTTVLGAGVPGRRQLQVGSRRVTFRHQPAWVLAQAGSPEGDVLAALHHLGRTRGQEVRALLARLDTATLGRLLALRPALPGWVADHLTLYARGPLPNSEGRP